MNPRGSLWDYFLVKDMPKATALLVSALRLLMFLVFAIWVSLWLLKPTQFWTQTWKSAENSAKLTVFGYYGLDFAVYTFPVIALAIIGCLFFSFLPREPTTRSIVSCLWEPLVVNTLVGVISTAELISVSLFLLFLAWTFYARVSNDFSKLMPDNSLKLWQVKYLRIATRLGLLAEACLAMMLLPILRAMSLFRVIGIQFEASVRYHIWLGTAMVVFATLHGGSTLFIWGITRSIRDEAWKWQRRGRINIAGEIALVTILTIWVTSLPAVRRRKFEIFYYTHHLYIIFFIFFLLHAGDRHFYMVFSGLFLFALDKLLRIIQSKPETCILSATIFPCNAVELILPKETGLKYTPTSVVLMKVASISATQWHAFSVCSSCGVDDRTLSVIVKREGSWTDSLYQMIDSEVDCVLVGIEGPYGPATLDFFRFDNLLMIAGGIGITPFLSILQEIESVQGRISRYKFPSKVHLVYVVKKCDFISLLTSISPLLLNPSAHKCHLKLQVFVTQQDKPNLTVQQVLINELSRPRTVEFNTKRSSFHVVHGIQSWVSMAALMGFSSILFLVLVMCSNRVFVVQKGGPSWVVDLIVVLCFVMAMVCSALLVLSFRWRKVKKEDLKVSQYESKGSEGVLMEDSGGLEEHEVHFGARPHFEDIFEKYGNEGRGSDVGVLVCGPETMTNAVAKTCRKQPNFTFHSLNFTL